MPTELSLSESNTLDRMKKFRKEDTSEEWKVIIESGDQTNSELHPVKLTKATVYPAGKGGC